MTRTVLYCDGTKDIRLHLITDQPRIGTGNGVRRTPARDTRESVPWGPTSPPAWLAAGGPMRDLDDAAWGLMPWQSTAEDKVTVKVDPRPSPAPWGCKTQIRARSPARVGAMMAEEVTTRRIAWPPRSESSSSGESLSAV